MTNRESLINFKITITKCDKRLLQSVTGITKWEKIYYRVLQELQSVTVITKWDVIGCIWINLGSRYTWDKVFKNGPSKIF